MTKRIVTFILIILLGSLYPSCTNGPAKGEHQTKPIHLGPLAMIQVIEGKWVIIDEAKTRLYEVFPYENGPDYPSEGLIRIVKNGKIGYADAVSYKLIIEPQYDCAFPFENGKAKVSNECQTEKDGEHSVWTSDTWKYIDKEGKTLLDDE